MLVLGPKIIESKRLSEDLPEFNWLEEKIKRHQRSSDLDKTNGTKDNKREKCWKKNQKSLNPSSMKSSTEIR